MNYGLLDTNHLNRVSQCKRDYDGLKLSPKKQPQNFLQRLLARVLKK
jgi:hypothetical protein